MPVQIYLKIDGTDAAQEIMDDIISVEVDQSLHLPDMFSIRLEEDFDEDKGIFKWADSNTFALGKSVEIEVETDEPPDLAAPEKGTLLKGEITAVEPEFSRDGGATTVIRGYDKSHRLHLGRRTRTFLKTKDSQIAQKIAGECGLGSKVDGTGKVHEYVFQDNQTDMEFLQARARHNGCYVYVTEGTLHFVKKLPPAGQPPVLTWGDNLRAFQVRLTAAEQVSKVTVRGWNPTQKQAIIGTANSPQGTPKLNDTTSGGDAVKKAFKMPNETLVTNGFVTDGTDAKTLAQSICHEIGNAYIQAEGTCVGSPQVSAGATVKLESIGKRFSGDYWITRAVHRYKEGDYETWFEVSGRRSNTLGQLLGTKGSSGNSVVVGIVTQNKHPEGLPQVKVKFPSISEDEESAWARLVSPMAGNGRGFEFIPEIDDEVLVAFEYGDIHRPYILGALWNGKDKPPEGTDKLVGGSGKVDKRIIKSRSGHTVTLDDTQGKEKISIVDKTGNNSIEIDSKSDAMAITIKADKKIEIGTGGGHKVILDDTAGTLDVVDKTGKNSVKINSMQNSVTVESAAQLNLKANMIKIEAQANLDIKSTGMVNIEGLNTTMKGNAMVTIQGGLVKIN